MGDKTRGLIEKFTVTRNDGKSDPGGKHDGCRYFVLDMDHDAHAVAALKAYAESCRDAYPKLAADLFALLAGSTCSWAATPIGIVATP